MALRLEAPPVREPMVDKNGNVNPIWARWLVLLHQKTGGTEAALPVSLGGSGATSVVGALAVQTAGTPASSGGSSSSTVTKRKTFALNRPASGTAGDSANTVCTWDTPFADGNYTVTADFIGSAGTISVSAITATGFTITLTNTGQISSRFPDGIQASGTADCIGVHR